MPQACDIGLVVSMFSGLGLVRGIVNDDQPFNLCFLCQPILYPQLIPLHPLSNEKKEKKKHAIRDMGWLRLDSFDSTLHDISPGWMADEGEEV